MAWRISSLDGVADQQLGWRGGLRGGSAAWMARQIAWRISSLDGEADHLLIVEG
jgi:hypothetical protein